MHATLEAEELAFLRDLMRREIARQAPMSMPLPQASPLSALLQRAGSLTLNAVYEHHELQFEAVVEVNDHFEAELQLRAPEIVERGQHTQRRPWRYRPENGLQLLDHKGERLDVDVVELSHDSLALKPANQGTALDKQLELQLALPEGEPLSLSARWVRNTAQGAAAYTFDLEPTARDSLRWFLLDRHPVIATEEP